MRPDHYVGGNKLIGYDPLEKWACVAQELAQKLKASNERVKELRQDLDHANERVKQLEEQILKAQKHKEITHKAIEQIAREGATQKTIEVLLNAHFWGLV
jgi:TolA-binding protein